LYFFF